VQVTEDICFSIYIRWTTSDTFPAATRTSADPSLAIYQPAIPQGGPNHVIFARGAQRSTSKAMSKLRESWIMVALMARELQSAPVFTYVLIDKGELPLTVYTLFGKPDVHV
jgi:hypothetical protein